MLNLLNWELLEGTDDWWDSYEGPIHYVIKRGQVDGWGAFVCVFGGAVDLYNGPSLTEAFECAQEDHDKFINRLTAHLNDGT